MSDKIKRRSVPVAEAIILFFIFLLVCLVSFSGVHIYGRLSSLTDDLKNDRGARNQISMAKQLYADLYEAESQVRAYYNTRDTSYRDEYEHKREEVEDDLGILENLMHGNQLAEDRKDSIEMLAEQRMDILETWLILDPDEKVTRELSKISLKLDPDKQPAPVVQEKPVKKRRKKKDTAPVVVEKNVDFYKVKEEVSKVKKKQTSQLREINEHELTLNIMNKETSEQLRELISRMETEDDAQRKQNNELAIQRTARTNFIIALFCASSAIMLIAIGIILLRYIIKTRHYNSALRKAQEEAENLARAKQNFLANMTHEIRTPINSIIGFSEQLDKTTMSEGQKEQLDIIRKSSTHLLQIVNDVLDYSKLQAGKFSFEKINFSPSDTIREVVQILSAEAEQKNIALYLETAEHLPRLLNGDPFRLKQILLNVVGNAIKFTSSGSVFVHIDALAGKENETRLKMKIQDTGVGIPAKMIHKVFDDFEQVDSHIAKKFKGTGLGLSITKKLVEHQGGSVVIHSKEGEGTTVEITIPYGPPVAEAAEMTNGAAENAHRLEGVQLLVVDDEPFNRKLVETVLGQWGMQVTSAADGETAIDMLYSGNFSMMLLDIRMPGMSGFEVTRKLRKSDNPALRNIIIIALTASNDREKEALCREVGMNDFLSKPFTEKQLLDMIWKNLPQPGPEIANNFDQGIEMLRQLDPEDKQFVPEMANLFIKGAKEGMHSLRMAAERRDWKALHDAAHKMAPSCRHIGALRMLSLLEKIERLKNPPADEKEAVILVNVFEAECLAGIQELETYLR